MQPIEVTAKKVDDAIKEGLKILGTTLDKVEYKIISSGGLFKKAKVSISLLEDESAKADKRDASASEHKKPQEKPRETFGQKVATQKPRDNRPQGEPQKSNQPQSTLKDNQGRGQQRDTEAQKPQQKESFSAQRPQKSQQKPKQATENRKEMPKRPQRDTATRSAEKSEPKDDSKRRIRSEEITEDEIKAAVSFMTELIGLMGVEAEVKAEVAGGDLIIDLVSQNGALIGYRGETLDALEYLVSIHVNKSNDKYISIVVDSCGYRQKREKMLVTMAEKAASRCIKTGRKVVMEPMNRSSRKVVHSTLSEYDNITSKSEGTEPNRHIVIFFKRERKG